MLGATDEQEGIDDEFQAGDAGVGSHVCQAKTKMQWGTGSRACSVVSLELLQQRPAVQG